MLASFALGLVLLPSVGQAGPTQQTTCAPTLTEACDDGTNIEVYWEWNTGCYNPAKFSVEVIATFCDGGVTLAFPYGVARTGSGSQSFNVPDADIVHDCGSGPVGPDSDSVFVHVKDLNPPGRKSYNQSNPFGALAGPVDVCE